MRAVDHMGDPAKAEELEYLLKETTGDRWVQHV